MNTTGKKLNRGKKIVIAVLCTILLLILLFLHWASKVSDADSVKLNEFYKRNASSIVVNEHSSYWEIIPTTTICLDHDCQKSLDTGVIFYPGAKIDPRAYFYKLDFLTNGQPLRTKLFITKPPLHLAFFGIKQADEIIKNNPSVKNWIIGGHSLGGSMACEYAKSNSEKISELLLFGSYCGSSVHDTNLKVISIHGSVDGIFTPEKVSENKKNLPDSSKDFIVSGMNHAQAGNYGDQSGDKAATKSDEEVKTEIKAILLGEIAF